MSAAMTTATDYAIEMDGLTRRFGDFVAVNNVTLKIPKGQLYGFLGLNGAGKTTTIRMLTTLLPPSAGTAKLHTGPTRELGGDIDAFEERLVKMLTQSERVEPAGLHFRVE